MRKRLKRVRRSAGRIRDIDVLLERIGNLETGRTSGVSPARRRLRNRRRALADELQAAASREVDRHFQRRITRIARRTRWREAGEEPPLVETARALLRPLTDRLRKAGAQNLSDLPQLHGFRVAVKRVRYALDLLESGLDAGTCAPLRAQLSELQSSLGRVCDHAAAVRLLEKERESLRDDESHAALESMICTERELLAGRQAAFIAGWESHARDDLERALDACLA